METEYEAKFYPVDKDDIRKKLEKIGAELIVPERKMRRALIGSETNPQFKCNYIRVRDEGDKITLSAKIHAESDGKVSDQKEAVVEVSDYEDTVKIFKMMAFEIDMYQETLRETWEYEDAEIVIDTWPGLEPYIEIEAKSEQQVKEIGEKLGFDWDDKYITAVSSIFSDVYGLTVDEVMEKIENITFKNNPFQEIEKKV